MCKFSFGFSSPSQPPVSLSGNTSRRRPAQSTIFYRCAGLNLRESPKNQSLVLFNMRMHIKTWGLDGWQQWSSPSDFENLDFFSLVCHVVHSSGWIDLPVCGLQMYHLEISWSCTFSKQMCYLTIGSASTVFFNTNGNVICIACISKLHLSARMCVCVCATIAVSTKDCHSHIAALCPLHSQICALGNRAASFFNFCPLSILEVDYSSAAELCGDQHPPFVGFSERIDVWYILVPIDGP